MIGPIPKLVRRRGVLYLLRGGLTPVRVVEP